MRRTRVGAAVGLALALAASSAPAPALPPGPPAVSLTSVHRGGTTLELIADVTDPDGDITSISICAEDVCAVSAIEGSDAVGSVLTCLNGDEEVSQVGHTFASPGAHEVVVSATGSGCPVIGSSQTVTRTFLVHVPVPPPPPEPVPCAEEGTPTVTAPGVDPQRVTLAATVSLTGRNAAYAGGADIAAALTAAQDAVNASGGVCGRDLAVEIADDGGSDQRLHTHLTNAIHDPAIFGIVGTDVSSVVLDGSLDAAGVPAIGTPAARAVEFDAAWIWPLGTGNHAFGRIAVDHALGMGASTFALVHDERLPSALETAEAVRAAVAAAPGATLVADIGVDGAEASYSEEVAAFNGACEDGCDAVVYALEPTSQIVWLAGRPRRGSLVESAHPASFGERFAQACGDRCRDITMWGHVQPLIGAAPEGSERACSWIQARRPQADCSNPAVFAAYESVWLAAQAMGAAGVDLTREGVRSALEAITFDPGVFGAGLSWTHHKRANRWQRGYSVVLASGSFAGFRDETGWREDPQP